MAAKGGKEELVRVLLDEKADPNLTDLDGNFPLDLAAAEQHETVVNILLEHSTSFKTDDIWKKAFRNAMKSEGVDDSYVKEVIKGMSPPRCEC